MAERVVFTGEDLATESGRRINAAALLGPQAAAVTVAALTATEAAGAAPDAAEYDALVADVTALHANVEALVAALTNNGTLAAS